MAMVKVERTLGALLYQCRPIWMSPVHRQDLANGRIHVGDLSSGSAERHLHEPFGIAARSSTTNLVMPRLQRVYGHITHGCGVSTQ